VSAEDLELAERAAREAGEVLLEWFGRTPEGLASKTSVTDPVSEADRQAERTIRDLLAAERPDDGILGEEGTHTPAANGRTWIVDPLDGTVNFLYGMRTWAVSIALEDSDGVAVGVVYNPVDGECFSARRGEGAVLNGEPLNVTECAQLDRAMVGTGFSYEAPRRETQAELLVNVLPRVRDVRRAGAAALDLAYVAAGRYDAFYEHGLKRWDEAAGVLLVKEAGGVVDELSGDPPCRLAAGTEELLGALRPVLRGK
jgi:myo-inositol-1(or 4)-monophosphatase